MGTSVVCLPYSRDIPTTVLNSIQDGTQACGLYVISDPHTVIDEGIEQSIPYDVIEDCVIFACDML